MSHIKDYIYGYQVPSNIGYDFDTFNAWIEQLENKEMVAMETYQVKFWITNEQGYREKRIEDVTFNSDNKKNHAKAERVIKEKYRQKPYLQHVDIISVIYQ